MLLELKVKDFAIIDSIDINFQQGLNILSGETGAGKSVLLKSLSLLMGDKAYTDIVRTSAEQAVIEGYFDISNRPDIVATLDQMGIDTSEDSLVVRRVISFQGKSRVYLNGSLSALGNLKNVVAPLIEVTGQATPLIEMTGQHDNRHLQSKTYHLDLLDHFTNSWKLRANAEALFKEIKDCTEKIKKIEEDSRMREQRLDFLNFQKEEIEALDLNPGEEQDLENSVGRLKNASRLSQFADSTENTLYSSDNSVLVQLHNLIQESQALAKLDSSLSAKIEPLTQAKALIEDCVYELREYSRDLNVDPASLNNNEEKLSLLRRLQKKYGGSVEDILLTLEQINDEILGLENSDQSLSNLKKELKILRVEHKQVCEELHKRRKEGCDKLSQGVNNELNDLNMKGVSFAVDCQRLDEAIATGVSDVEFMIQASKKDKLRPISKVASGGELSRILLSLKTVVGNSDSPRTYLFDEVDAGVSGPTAEKVGRKLKAIALGQQVICVTHLPQVASFADAHYFIHKEPNKNGIKMFIDKLDDDHQVEEIARLISGEKITKSSRDHAKQLLKQSR